MKNSSKNVESRIGIRDSKFSASVFTPSGTFIFEKNHVETPPFLGGSKKCQFLAIFGDFRGLGGLLRGPKSGKCHQK